MKFIKKIIKLSVIFTLVLSFSNISSSSEKNYYKDLITDWSRIFPDKNRNAAGPKFFKYIIDKDITYKDFIEYNKMDSIKVKSIRLKLKTLLNEIKKRRDPFNSK